MTVIAPATSTRHIVFASPIGPLTVVREDAGITGLYFPGHWTRPDTSTFGPQVEAADDDSFDDVVAQLNEYFAGQRHNFDLPLVAHGDETATKVWNLLGQIPYGQTTTYGALAKQLDDGHNPREVGRLVGQNPLSILIGCHRVVGANGTLTGYAGGLARKQFLLELERAGSGQGGTLW